MNKIVGLDSQLLNKDKNMPEVKYIQFEQENEKDLLQNKIKNILSNGVKKERQHNSLAV